MPDESLIFCDLCVVNADGTGLRVIRPFRTQTSNPPDFSDTISWSPDGQFVLYNLGGNLGRPEVVDPDTGVWAGVPDSSRPYGPGRCWRFGRDEAASTPGFQGLLAFNCFGNYDNDIAVVRATIAKAAEGTIEFTLSSEPADQARLFLAGTQRFPAFSPDGATLAFLDGGWWNGGSLLKLVPIPTGAPPVFGVPTLLCNWRDYSRAQGFFGSPAWAPDGSWIAFAAYPDYVRGGGWSDIYRIRPNGSGLVAVTPLKDSMDAFAPNWNPAWENDLGP